MMKYYAIVLAAVLLLSGCSSEGILKIANESGRGIWGQINGNDFITPGESVYTNSWDLNTSIFGNESKKITITFNGYYVFRDTVKTSVNAGNTRKVKIYAEAGAIEIENHSDVLIITEVNIASHSDAYWGDNDLGPDNPILPGGSVGWTVDDGCWDIRIINSNNVAIEIIGEDIETNSTLILEYDGFKKSNKISNKQEGTSLENLELKVERVQ